MKFEEAFCKIENRNVPVDEIARIHQTQPAAFSDRYKNHFFCPECNQAQLSFHNAEPPYFQTYPHSAHLEHCSLKQPEMTRLQADRFVADEENRERLSRQMESLMVLLLKEKVGNTRTSHGSTHRKEEVAEQLVSANLHLPKRFPRKRIDTIFREEDFDCNKFFYGDVLMNWEEAERENKHYFKLLLRHPITHKMLCVISVSDKVYKYIPSEHVFNGERSGKIVFLASLKKTAKWYYRTWLLWSAYLKICFTD